MQRLGVVGLALLWACGGRVDGDTNRDPPTAGKAEQGEGGAVGAGGEGATSGGGVDPMSFGGLPLLSPCGDGHIEPGETCDDANSERGDGCDDSCNWEPGYVCLEVGQPCVSLGTLPDCDAEPVEMGYEGGDCQDMLPELVGELDGEPCHIDCLNGPYCGDRIVQPEYEQCDDGNNEPGDGCDERCQIEASYDCRHQGQPCVWVEGLPPCSSTAVQASNDERCGTIAPIVIEEHDGQSCFNECFEVLRPFCGDGMIDSRTEQCDDANNEPGDGCDEYCREE